MPRLGIEMLYEPCEIRKTQVIFIKAMVKIAIFSTQISKISSACQPWWHADVLSVSFTEFHKLLLLLISSYWLRTGEISKRHVFKRLELIASEKRAGVFFSFFSEIPSGNAASDCYCFQSECNYYSELVIYLHT